ncbi:MAG: hypothetical protein EXR86_13315 [Gammaproteobacteria bacterium]|nr:hypothetical protein [Gammaproteobacteria bacterium]
MANPSLTKERIIDRHVLTFDPVDKRNGSLYLGEPLEEDSGLHLASTLRELRAAGLWSEQPEKQVPDAHRAAYREQLSLVDVVSYSGAAGGFLIARFDHPKFPSDEARWNEWVAYFDAHFTRT